MPVPHYHESWDEIVYGLTGTATWRIDGEDINVTPRKKHLRGGG
jgi:quercetin dioxygenase-like cupin family protein